MAVRPWMAVDLYDVLCWCRHVAEMASDVSRSVVIRQLAAVSHWRIRLSHLSTVSRWLLCSSMLCSVTCRQSLQVWLVLLLMVIWSALHCVLCQFSYSIVTVLTVYCLFHRRVEDITITCTSIWCLCHAIPTVSKHWEKGEDVTVTYTYIWCLCRATNSVKALGEGRRYHYYLHYYMMAKSYDDENNLVTGHWRHWRAKIKGSLLVVEERMRSSEYFQNRLVTRGASSHKNSALIAPSWNYIFSRHSSPSHWLLLLSKKDMNVGWC